MLGLLRAITIFAAFMLLQAPGARAENPIDYKQCRLIGDINSDGSIDIRDLSLLRNILSGTLRDYNYATADIDQNGRINNNDLMLLEAQVASIEGAYDFGGMFGACGPGGPPPGSYVNPVTNGYSCPSGYSAVRASGTPGVDWPVYYCVRRHVAGRAPDYDFGGMFGTCGPGGPPPGVYTNPTTGAYSCPATYRPAPVVGTPGRDWSVSYCMRQHSAPREQDYDFGGVFGTANPGAADPGYKTAFVAGTPNIDWPLAFAYRRHDKPILNPRFTPLYGVDAPASFTSPARFGPFQLPYDEAGHNNTTEWWYLNGHLTFGYGSNQYDFMANFFDFKEMGQRKGQFLFVLTDSGRRKYYSYSYDLSAYAYSIARDGVALSYNAPNPEFFTRVDRNRCIYSLHLENPKDKIILDLKLTAVKPPVPIGENGYIFMAANEISAYYAQPRLFAEGTLQINGTSKPVCGISWVDRQWGNFNQRKIAWKWFSVQLENNTEIEIMFAYDRATGAGLRSFANYIDASGRVQMIRHITVKDRGYWVSPVTGCKYSSGWEINTDDIGGGITLTITPRLREQEFTLGSTGVFLWEGSCDVIASINGSTLRGECYAEVNKTER